MKEKPARRAALLLAVALGGFIGPAIAQTPPPEVRGQSALALAGVVALHAPRLDRASKNAVAQLFAGEAQRVPPGLRKIVVTADQVDCAAGDVDITYRSCTLSFGKQDVTLTGREANELYATLAAAGVPADEEAGKMHESVEHLVCRLNVAEIRQNSGGGADCTYSPM